MGVLKLGRVVAAIHGATEFQNVEEIKAWLTDEKNVQNGASRKFNDVTVGFFLMGLMNAAWPLIVAVAITVACSMFVQGAEGATFGIIPSIKRRVTGQISGMAGAYGNVGAVCYLTLFTFVTPSQFFMVIAAGAFVSFGLDALNVFCDLRVGDLKVCRHPQIVAGGYPPTPWQPLLRRGSSSWERRTAWPVTGMPNYT